MYVGWAIYDVSLESRTWLIVHFFFQVILHKGTPLKAILNQDIHNRDSILHHREYIHNRGMTSQMVHPLWNAGENLACNWEREGEEKRWKRNICTYLGYLMTKLSLYHSLLGFPRVDTWAGNKWFCWLLIVLVEKQECSCMLLEEKLPYLHEAHREGPRAEIIWLHKAIILWVGGLVANTPNLPRLPSLLLLLLLISWKDRQTKELWITWLEQVCLKLISKKCMKRYFLYLREGTSFLMLGSFYVNAAWQPCVAAVYWRRASELVLNIACLKHTLKSKWMCE